MCGRFVQYSDPEIYARCFALDSCRAAEASYNRAPSQNILAIRANAQGLIAMVTYGVGMFIGSRLSGRIVEHYQTMEGGEIVACDWPKVWLIMGGMAFAVIVLFAILFKDKVKAPEEAAQVEGS